MPGITKAQRAEVRRLAVALLPRTRDGSQQWDLGTMGELSSLRTRIADGRYVNIARAAVGTHVEIQKGLSHVSVWFPRDRDLHLLRRAAAHQVRMKRREERSQQSQPTTRQEYSQEKTARDILGC